MSQSLHEMQEFTRIARYARYNKEKKRREKWSEQVGRVINMHRNKYAEIIDVLEPYIKDAEDAMLDKDVLGSQRALQFGGPAILKKNARLYNCFRKDTQFITDSGVKSFADYSDGDEVMVLTHTGSWKKGIVRNYGVDDFNKITFTRGSSRDYVVYATEDHTWILKNGERTTDLQVGDRLFKQPNIFNEWEYYKATPNERLYWAYGYIYGDGTRLKDENGEYRYSMVRLCGHDKQYQDRFEELGFKTSSSNSLNGDFMAHTGTYLKTTPHVSDGVDLIRAFVRGFLDADGEKNSNINRENHEHTLFKSIQQSSTEAQKFIESIFPMVGVYTISKTHLDHETNFGVHDAMRYSVSTHSGLTTAFWKVKSIERNADNGETWCLEVEDDHSFVMPNGIVTGNCTASYADRPRFFQETMYLLLCGAGVGFSVQKHHVAKLPDVARPTGDTVTYTIPDSIEGWADAIGVLMSSYFVERQPFPEFFGKNVEFDYSLIRPKGAVINDTNGKAPGPDGLRASIEKIRSLMDSLFYQFAEVGEEGGVDTVVSDTTVKMLPIQVYDIIMHTSDAVLSGGVRRSATICIFSPDDMDMVTAKTGDWFIKNPQRGRSNNSALLIRGETSPEEFHRLFESVREFGEPGFIWSDSREILFNPCVEIGLYAYDKNGNSGWAFCNLCEINVKQAKTPEKFMDACRKAAILGTLQAGYADFPYLLDPLYGYNVTEAVVRGEALLGCSMTGMMDNPAISFNPELQQQGALLIRKTNEEVAKVLGINVAARTTCVKPAGSTSAILGTASGIHPHHAKRYFRRIQVNKMEEPLKFFKMFNSEAVRDSVWSRNKTDEVITFLCEVPTVARTKNDIGALELLEHVKLTQQNWVEYGTNVELCALPSIRHNISNTINVRDNEWEATEAYIYENRQWFGGISLLSMSGDKDYAQAPFQAVYTPEELVKMYGDASVFASGLVVHAQNSFDDNLYAACDTLLGTGEPLPKYIDAAGFTNTPLNELQIYIQSVLTKQDWVRRAEKFTRNYFLPVVLEKYGVDSIASLGDSELFNAELVALSIDIETHKKAIWQRALRKMTYCLKDVDAWKTWVDLKRSYSPVPWDQFEEVIDNTKLTETSACQSGQCEITKM